MDNKEIIETAAAKLGREKVFICLTLCAKALETESMQLNKSLSQKNEQKEQNEFLRQKMCGILAETLIAIDMVCEYISRDDVRECVRQRMIGASKIINAAPLP